MKLVKKSDLPNTLVKARCHHCGAYFEFMSDEAQQILERESRRAPPANFIERLMGSGWQDAQVIKCIVNCPNCGTPTSTQPEQEIEWSEPYCYD